MPTYDRTPRFRRDYAALTPAQRAAFRRALRYFIEDIRRQRFRPSLRVKGVQGKPGVFEMSWAADGRAFFRYATPVHAGEPHIIWERCGTHDIFDE